MFARLITLALSIVICTAIDRYQGRHSYSLTTFDPSGKLGQVERALLAAEQGTPIVAWIQQQSTKEGVAVGGGVILAAPQVLPDAFATDDGTGRFARITPEILVAHSGLSADGRILVSSAHRMAVEHEYTFDEDIGIALFLEEFSLLFQEYTMKPAARPFGASLVVAYLPQTDKGGPNTSPMLFKIDPSGNVEALDGCAVIHGRLEQTDLLDELDSLIDDSFDSSIDICREKVVDLLRSALQQQATRKGVESFEGLTVLTATLSRYQDGKVMLRKHRYEPDISRSG